MPANRARQRRRGLDGDGLVGGAGLPHGGSHSQDQKPGTQGIPKKIQMGATLLVLREGVICLPEILTGLLSHKGLGGADAYPQRARLLAGISVVVVRPRRCTRDRRTGICS